MFSKGTGGTDSARYCYSVLLRHLVKAYNNQLPTNPKVVAELGPGDSLGTGLAALISGADHYYGFDVIEYSTNQRNFEIFDELVELFKNREKIPGKDEFPMVRPYLDTYEFPRHILTDERLNESLRPDRIAYIKNALSNPGKKNDQIMIAYFVPWDDIKVIKYDSVDMLFTQGVMQLVDNLQNAYQVISRWLKPGGFMSHETDFTSYRTAEKWNGYWAYSDFFWKLMKGKRLCLTNRSPHSMHIQLMEDNGFKIVCDHKISDMTGIKRSQLAPRFRNLSDDDLTTSGAFIQAIKK
jgi:SAM-dependent methyltransferase